MASSEVVPPMRRSFMPVRSVIQASLVSSRADRSSFVTTLSGTAEPQPVMTAPTSASLQDVHGDDRGVASRQDAARVDGERGAGAGLLTVAGPAPQLQDEFGDLAQAGGAERMAASHEAAA